MPVFHLERNRLVVTHETAAVVAEDRDDAIKQAEDLLDSEWNVKHLSSSEASERIDMTRLTSAQAAQSTAKYEAVSWRFVAICFAAVTLLKSIGAL